MDTKTLFMTVLIAGILGGFALNNSLFNATIEVGAEAPDFTLVNPDGNEFSLSDFEGEKVIVLEFMNMRCGTCKNFEENSLKSQFLIWTILAIFGKVRYKTLQKGVRKSFRTFILFKYI